MSKLSDALASRKTGLVTPPDSRLRIVLEERERESDLDEDQIEYMMRATIGAAFTASKSQMADPVMRKILEDDARDIVLTEVFGEFREPINRAIRAVRAGDWMATERILLKVLDRMYCTAGEM